MIKLGTSDMAKAYVGSTEVSKMYLGSDLVYTKEVLPYDAEIEYIEGGIYQTAFIPSGDAVHRWKYQCKQKINYSYVFACTPIESGKWYIFSGWNGSSAGSQILYGSSSKYGGKNLALNTDYVGEADFSGSTKVLKWNNSTIISLSAATITNTYPLAIQLSKEGVTGWRLYWYKCYIGSMLVADIIPVRIGQVGYLYDKISKSLIGNSDTNNTPVLGQDI